MPKANDSPSFTKEEIKAQVKNPEIRKLLDTLETMPERLAERRRKLEEKKEFRRKVFEKACRQAGLIP